MGQLDHTNAEVERRYQELCADLNMDRTANSEAWQSYEKITSSYSLEGEPLHWLACALYVACRNGSVPTVGKAGTLIEGNCVSLTRLLRSSKLTLGQFFNKIKKWQDMANLPQNFRVKIDKLERNFAVSKVIYQKFVPIYETIFRAPVDEQPRQHRSRKQKRPPCSSAEVFQFCWTLFVQVKAKFPSICDDLVNSYHLLLCCFDLVFTNAIVSQRTDLINLQFQGVPPLLRQSTGDSITENADTAEPVSSEPVCIIQLLCEMHDGIVIEAKGIKEHWWKPYIKKLFDKNILKGKSENLSGLLDSGNFEHNGKIINKTYEEYVLGIGDFDERVFLGSDDDIGTPVKQAGDAVKQSLQKHLEKKVRALTPQTPLTGKYFLVEKEAYNVTPVSTATQSVSKLQTLLSGRKTAPSEALVAIFNECKRNPEKAIADRVKTLGDLFCTSYAQPSENDPGSHVDFAKARLQLGESLYYKFLENIITMETKRREGKYDLTALLEQDHFHRSLFACCMEIVIFSYNSQRVFPWIIEVYGLEPYYFYKVIEPIIRAEDSLWRDVVKHMSLIEEQILESLAWKSDSPLWDGLSELTNQVPSCDDVSLPNPAPSENATPDKKKLKLHPLTPSTTAGMSPMSVLLSSSVGQSSPTVVKRKLFAVPASSNLNQTPARTVSPMTHLVQISPSKGIYTLQTQSDGSIAYLIPVQSASSGGSLHGASKLIATVSATARSDPVAEQAGKADPPKTKKSGAIALFFRKFYHLASVRLRDLCDHMDIQDAELRQKMWTCFEYAIVNHVTLMSDRHLDQVLMCTVYIVCKVTGKDKNFQEIIRCYRIQPQASNHVYRSVLLTTKQRRNSGSSIESFNSKQQSGSNSPVNIGANAQGDTENADAKRKERLTIRSSSTLPPSSHPSSQPPTPTKLAGTSSSFEFEDRGDIIKFYNQVFMNTMQTFALKFSAENQNKGDAIPLSPMPVLKAHPLSPRRRISTNHSVYISPLKVMNPLALTRGAQSSPGRPLLYSFNRSPAKDLKAINHMVRRSESGRINKRILGDEDKSGNADSIPVEVPAKKPCTDQTFLRKIENVINERQQQEAVAVASNAESNE